jgi:NADH pyrophosphatase NudC (nudix superfamily)
VNYGEDLESACLRELSEECNLKGKNPKLVKVNFSYSSILMENLKGILENMLFL